MIYLVHTIKESDRININTDFVIEAWNEDEIKSLMSKYRIIVLWISHVGWRPSSWQFFWNFQTQQNKNFKFCLKAESLESACIRCIELDLPITSINDILHPINEQESNTLIQKIITQKQNTIIQQQIIQEEESQKKLSTMDDKRKNKIMTVITETLQEINTIEENFTTQPISFEKKRKLHELKETLTKIKMWSNLEKATSILEESFILMESIETENLWKMKEEEQKIMNSSIISNVDIISELEKIKRANQTTQAGIKKNSSDLYYTYLGIAWLYQKFILKDIINKFLEFKKILLYTIEHIGFSITCTITFLWLLFSYHIYYQDINTNMLLSMITLWIFWITRELPLAVRKSSFVMSIIYIILAIIISIIIQKLLIVNFALV
jgi:hypothetical protein